MDPGIVALVLAIIVVLIIFAVCLAKSAGKPAAETDADQYVKMLYGDDSKKNKKAKSKNKTDDKKKAVAAKLEEEVKQVMAPVQKKAKEIVKRASPKVERTPTPEEIPQDPRDESSERGSTDDAPAPRAHVEKKQPDSRLRSESEKLISTLKEFPISEKVYNTVVEKIRQLDHHQQMSKTHRNQIDSLEKAGRQANDKIASMEKKLADDQRRMKEMHQTIEGEKNKSKRLDQEITEKSQLLNATIKSLKDQNDTLENDAATLRDQIAHMAKTVNDERARAEQYRHKNAALETEKLKMAQEIKASAHQQPEKIQQVQVQPAAAAPPQSSPADQQAIAKLQHQLNEESQQHKAARNELHKVQKLYENASSQHHNLMQRFTELETELKSARAHSEHAAAGNDNEKVIHELQSEVEKLGLKRNDMEQQMTTLTHERDRLHKAHKQAEGTIQSLKQKLAEQTSTDQAQLQEARATIQTLESTIEQLKGASVASNGDGEAENQQLISQINDLKRSVTEAEQQRDVAKSEANGASAQNADAQQTIANLKQEVTALNRKIAELNEQLNSQSASLNGKIDELSRERIQLQQRLTEAQNVKATPVSASSVDAGSEKVAAELQAKNEELRAKNYKMVDAVAQAEKVSTQLAQEKAKLEHQIKELTKSFDELKKKSHDEVQQQKEVKFVETAQNGHDSAELLTLREENNNLKDALAKLKAASSTKRSTGSTSSDDVEQLLEENAAFRAALAALRDQLTTIESAERQEIEKYEAKCAWLHMQLQEATSTTAEAPPVDNKVNERLLVLERELETEKSEFTSLKELGVLQKALETERSTCQSLSQEAVKLRGMLKVGQEALKQEQSITANLREQLKHFQDNEHVNGL